MVEVVRHAVAVGVDVDRVGRMRLVRLAVVSVLPDERRAVAVDIAVAVGVVPRVGADVELPAVTDAVDVGVGVAGRQGVGRPVGLVLLKAVGDSHRIEVVPDEVLVQARERLRVDRAARNRRLGAEPVRGADLVVDESDRNLLGGGGHAHACRRGGLEAAAENLAVLVAFVERDAVSAELVAWLGQRLAVLQQQLRAVVERDEPHLDLLVGHHVAVDRVVGVWRERIGAVLLFPTVGHSVAVGVGVVRVGAVVFLVAVGGAVFVRVVGAGRHLGGRNPARHVLQAVGRPVLIDVRVLHHEEGGCGRQLGGRHLKSHGRVEVGGRGAHLADVAPGLVGVPDTIGVRVDERHHVVAAGRDAVEDDVPGRVGGDLGEGSSRVVDERRDGAGAADAPAGDRLGREVGRLIHAYDDVVERGVRRAEVPDLSRKASVSRIGVRRLDGGAERDGVAPDSLSELGIQLRDAPVVGRLVVEALAHVEVWLELAAVRRRGGHQVRGGIDDVCEVRVLRDLQRECRVAVRRLPHERRAGHRDDVAVVGAHPARSGRNGDAVELARERRRGVRRVVADIHLVVGGEHLVESGVGSVADEPPPVEVPVAGPQEVGLGERLAGGEVEPLRPDRARLRLLAVDRRAHHTHERLPRRVRLRRHVEGDGVGLERDFDLDAVVADVHIADEARLRAVDRDERVGALLQSVADERRFKHPANDRAIDGKHRVGLLKPLVAVRRERHVGRALVDAVDPDMDVRQRLAAVGLSRFKLVPGELTGNIVLNNPRIRRYTAVAI